MCRARKGEAVDVAPQLDLAPPFAGRGRDRVQRVKFFLQPRQDRVTIPDQADVHSYQLADRARVDIDMDDPGVRAKLVEPPGYPVIEAGADADDQVGPVHRQVCFERSMHA
jgi:hypothetical protein